MDGLRSYGPLQRLCGLLLLAAQAVSQAHQGAAPDVGVQQGHGGDGYGGEGRTRSLQQGRSSNEFLICRPIH